MKTTTTTTPAPAPGSRAALARTIVRAESALEAALGRLEEAIENLRTHNNLSQPGDIGRAAAEVEERRGYLRGLREAADC
jgi:hypothetical protein